MRQFSARQFSLRHCALLAVGALLGAAGAASGTAVGHAQAPVVPPVVAPAQGADVARLSTLSAADREALAPLLARGPVALVEFTDGDALPAILLAAVVDAPAATVAAVVGDPAGYPRFMGVLDSVQVTGRHANSLSYDWTWRTALFELRGANVMTSAAPSAAHPEQGWRFGVRATGGDLGTGRFLWRIMPMGPNRSIVTLVTRLDLRESNYLARQMSQASRSVNRSINLSLGFVMLLGARHESHRRANHAPTRLANPAAPLAPSEIDLERLAPLLLRGDLVAMTLDGDHLDHVTAIARTGTGKDVVTPVLTDPRAFGSALMPGSNATIVPAHDDDGGGTLFDWEVTVPIIGTSGRMRLTPTDASGEVVNVAGVSGSLRAGRWRFETRVQPWGEAVVVAIGRFDPGDTTWLLRGVVRSSADFGAGLAAATELMVARAIRTRAMDAVEAQAAAAAAAAEAEAAATRAAAEARVRAAAAAAAHPATASSAPLRARVRARR